jgi:hypothetical protein
MHKTDDICTQGYDMKNPKIILFIHANKYRTYVCIMFCYACIQRNGVVDKISPNLVHGNKGKQSSLHSRASIIGIHYILTIFMEVFLCQCYEWLNATSILVGLQVLCEMDNKFLCPY